MEMPSFFVFSLKVELDVLSLCFLLQYMYFTKPVINFFMILFSFFHKPDDW